MTDGLLEDIIRWEKQIKQQLATEEQRARSWLEQEQSVLAEDLAAARSTADAGDPEALAKARQDVRREAEALVRAAEKWCNRLRRLDDEALAELLQEHLALIMPETADDHPHGKS